VNCNHPRYPGTPEELPCPCRMGPRNNSIRRVDGKDWIVDTRAGSRQWVPYSEWSQHRLAAHRPLTPEEYCRLSSQQAIPPNTVFVKDV
jgi:hypothetical protein